MKIVIDIPEEIYQRYRKIWQKRRGSIPESCIAFGTPLSQEPTYTSEVVQKAYEDGKKDGYMQRKLEQEPSRDMEEIEEIINCDADAETKCKMISNILTAKPHYFEEPFINKPCVSSEVCKHDKQKVLDKIRAEMFEEMLSHSGTGEEVIQAYASGLKKGLYIIDKYKSESEG